MTGIMSPTTHIVMGPKESPQPYCEWYPGSFEVAGLEASARPPSYVHHSRSGMSRPVRTPKNIESVGDRSYDQIYDPTPTHPFGDLEPSLKVM